MFRLFISSVALMSSLWATDNVAIEVHPTGKVGMNLLEGVEPTAQLEVNGDAKIHGKFHLAEQTELPTEATQGDMVLLDNGTLHLYVGGEWRRVLLAVPDSNQAPVAVAGPDQVLSDNDNDGAEMVTLDASASTDDGSIAAYRWEMNGEVLAEEANPTVSIPNGFQSIQLVVTDNYGVESTDTLFVNVRMVDDKFQNSDLLSTLPSVAVPGTLSGSDDGFVGQIDFLESTTAKKTKTYNSITIDRAIGASSQFKVSFKLGLLNAESGDLRVRARVVFDTGTVNTSYYSLDSNDHENLEEFSVVKSIPAGATKITKIIIQSRTNNFPTPAQVGYIEDFYVEEMNVFNSL